MDSALLKRIATKYRQKYESYGQSNGASSFRDIMNLVMAMESINESPDDSAVSEMTGISSLRSFGLCTRALNDYFKLLDTYSDYREAELHGNTMGKEKVAGFPDLWDFTRSNEGVLEQRRIFGVKTSRAAEHYIMLSKKRLESLVETS